MLSSFLAKVAYKNLKEHSEGVNLRQTDLVGNFAGNRVDMAHLACAEHGIQKLALFAVLISYI